ncbi:MAG: tyrosine--tRNA ligase [Clostridia bacterium]
MIFLREYLERESRCAVALLDDLEWRGLVFQTTDREALDRRLEEGPITAYIGFDPTAESLHMGNLVGILMLRRFQLAGHHPIAVVGGATGLIGDPSFKSEERPLNPVETVHAWRDRIELQLRRFLDFDTPINPARVVDNYDWTAPIGVIEFLRDVGKHFSVNVMLNRESVASRLEAGISYTEFSYMLLQARDYLELFRQYDCRLQMGGSDQWGNIVAGVDLIRRSEGAGAHALTFPLITKSDGTKYGKTEGGAIWLDADKMSVFHYYQFWLTAEDADVVSLLKIFTFLSREEIEDLEASTRERPAERRAQRVLAEHVTTLTHGREAMEQARHLSELLFQGQVAELSRDEVEDVFEGVPTVALGPGAARDIQSVLVAAGASPSRRQAREDIQAGAIHVNGTRLGEVDHVFSDADLLHGRYLIIRRGRRNYFLARLGD